MRNLAYLACPYSTGIDEGLSYKERYALRQRRRSLVDAAAAQLFQVEPAVYSPITHGAAFEDHMDPTVADDWSNWMRSCDAFLANSHTIYVLKLVGWEKSKGVAYEINYAKRHSLKILFVEFNENFELVVNE